MQVNAAIPWQGQHLCWQDLAKGNNNKQIEVLSFYSLKSRLAGRIEASQALRGEEFHIALKCHLANSRWGQVAAAAHPAIGLRDNQLPIDQVLKAGVVDLIEKNGGSEVGGSSKAYAKSGQCMWPLYWVLIKRGNRVGRGQFLRFLHLGFNSSLFKP